MKEFKFSKVYRPTAKNRFNLKRSPFTGIFQDFEKKVFEYPFIRTPWKNTMHATES